MKITDIKTYVVKVSDQSSPWPWLFVEVETDEGITGLGEATPTHAAAITTPHTSVTLTHSADATHRFVT